MISNTSGRRRLRVSSRLLATTALSSVVLVAAATPSLAQAAFPCGTTNGQNCILSLYPGVADHTTGASNPDITVPFPTSVSYVGTDANGAIGITMLGGTGGDAKGDGDAGSPGGYAGGILNINAGSGVAATGIAPGRALVSFFSQGGTGGSGSQSSYGSDNTGNPGTGGNAGDVIVQSFNGTVATAPGDTSTVVALRLWSWGGAGGPGTDGGYGHYASNGGNGGNGGNASLTLGGSVTSASNWWGVQVSSWGGQGSNGANDITGAVQIMGGDGGTGGNAGNVSMTLASGATITAGAGYGLLLEAFGGSGGNGGNAYKCSPTNHDCGTADSGSGGNGGNGGTAGTITATLNGAITIGGGPGVMAVSAGGSGGAGGTADGFTGGGGGGGTAAPGGAVTITGSGGSISTAGADSIAVLAQSLGGGGGGGGSDSGGGFAVGGNGNSGASGSTVSVTLGNMITTLGDRSAGIVAQSIGGGGGNGGNASGSTAIVNYLVGGSGAGAGNGGSVLGGNSGTIQTSGQHSSGMVYQSIGGGGGVGGSAIGYTTSVLWGSAVTIGGTGGGGGDGSTVGDTAANRIVNSGTIFTTGADSHGILAQSIGGGGGVGGASVAQAYTIAVDTDDDPPLVNFSLAAAVGGAGGSGGAGGDVWIGNSGLIAVSGAGSSGLVAQSISGGGGAGGDSKASSTINGQGYSINTSLSIGGSGGGSDAAQTADAENSGVIIATGESGRGIVAQSIGGGGGAGGSGDGNAVSKGGSTTGNTSIGLGGTGGGGGNGGTANATNTGGILTLGDAGYGLLTQSIGGGGGAGGGAAATQSGGTLGLAVKTGGSGGSGGAGGSVTATNSGSIVTFGADATAIYAQSIGGGGGAGGKAGSSLGGKTTDNAGGNGNAIIGLQSGLNLGLGALVDQNGNVNANAAAQVAGKTDINSLISMANSLVGSGGTSTGNVANDLDSLSEDGGGATDGSAIGSFKLTIGVGGSGGSGGNGNTVTVANSGPIGTVGQMSDGIWAQSIGGGGGSAGAASASTGGLDPTSSFGVGGTGGSGGSGGVVNVSNTGGSITTTGGLANGIVAQSIGGGGGKGGLSGAKTGLLGVAISIGGDGGATGAGNTVTVDNGGGAVLTQSHRSIGIVAQSIGGGGGFVKTLSTDTNTGGGADLTGDTYQIGLTFGGSAGTCQTSGCADGGTVNVFNGSTQGTASTQPGTIATAGRDAYGIVAQSIGGGGGLLTGGTPTGTSFFGSGTFVGNGGSVNVETLGSITTSGDGAIGIVAQSIGGGGGFGGDPAAASNLVGFTGAGTRIGNGGPVTVTVDQGGSVATSGVNAPAIFAQSVGGGGGRVTTAAGAVNGWSGAGGSGTGGSVSVNVEGTVTATGSGSHGVYAQSTGTNGAGSVITINVGSASNTAASVTGGSGTAAGIFIDSGAAGTTAGSINLVTNYGTISAASGISVANTVGNVDVENYGTMAGGTSLTGGSIVHNYQQGTFDATQAVHLGGSGQFINDGKLIVGGAGRTATVQLDGKLTQTSTGTLVLDVDHVGRTADLLHVTQAAVIDGAIKVNPLSLSKTPATVLQADGGLTLAPTLGASPQLAGSHLFSYAASVVGSTLQVAAQPHFRDDNAVLGVTQQAAANYLQRVWDTDDAGRMSGAFLKLANAVGDTASYAGVLGGLASTAATRVGATQPQASVDFVTNMSNCPTLEGPGPAWRERDCVWGRAGAGRANVASSGGLAGFGQNRAVLQVGGQKEIADGWFLGGSLAYGSTTQSAGGAITDLDGSTGAAGLVLKREWDRWQFAVAVDGGFGRYDSSRYLGVNGAADITSASFGTQYAGLHGRVAYALPFGDWYLKPYVDAHAVYGHTDGYTEAGTALNMRVKGEGAVRFMVAPMLEAGTRIALGTGPTVRLYAAAGALLASDNGWTADASFVNAPIGAGSFRTETVLPRQMALVNVGAQVMGSGPWSAKLEYTGTYGDGYQSNAGSLKVEYRF